jgi:hypothetical protein
MPERGVVMLGHSLIIGIIIYAVLVFMMKTQKDVAENRSVFIAGLAMAYMVAFGHDAPGKLNDKLFG